MEPGGSESIVAGKPAGRRMPSNGRANPTSSAGKNARDSSLAGRGMPSQSTAQDFAEKIGKGRRYFMQIAQSSCKHTFLS
jgi:hypothetical protein